MRSDIGPETRFPDYELSDHTRQTPEAFRITKAKSLTTEVAEARAGLAFKNKLCVLRELCG